ncbi:hypothetical protein B9Z55_016481 [Caenorhabditis nigoni]|nr:hypothetical protein B9Z55_016481 [Caenorhabditis nigoni]
MSIARFHEVYIMSVFLNECKKILWSVFNMLVSFTIAEKRIDDKGLNKRKKRPTRLASWRAICYEKDSVLRRAVLHNDYETSPRTMFHFFTTII